MVENYGRALQFQGVPCNRNCPPSKPTSGHSKLRKIYGSKSYHFSITLVLKNAIFGPSQSRALPGLRNITK